MKIALLIHGPFSDYAATSVKKYEHLFDQVVISGYRQEEELWLPFACGKTLKMSEDVFNPGPWNVNRQLNLVSAGLKEIEPDTIILKLRSDQRVNFIKVLRYLNKNMIQFWNTPNYLTTNCFTRIDRLYHPSDMFVVGSHATLSNLFGVEPTFTTQLDAEILVRRLVDRGEDPNSAYVWPESYIFTKYLERMGWNLLGTYDDSQAALSRFVIIMNSMSVGLKWEKKYARYVFPFTAKEYPPFFGGPLEDSVCARATTPLNPISEFLFWWLAKIDSFIWVRTSPKKITKEMLLNFRMRIARFIVAWVPPIILSMLLKSFIYRRIKSIEAKIAKVF